MKPHPVAWLRAHGPWRPLTPADLAPLPRLVTFTVDVEDHPGPAARTGPPRHVLMTHRLLDLLDQHRGRGTFFIVGETAARTPDLVREIARRGHELALHSYRHVALAREDQGGFAAAIARSRAELQDLGGRPVLGFRAPRFSLDRRALWAVDAIAAAGFRYSSSVLPARSLAYGLPGAPDRPFRWPNGLLELPCPVGRVGPLAVPFLGGMYLRYLPPWRLRRLVRSLGDRPAWTYCHPYDLDRDEPFAWRSASPAGLFLRLNRGVTAQRLRLILQGRRSLSFAERLEQLGEAAAAFTPPPSPVLP